MSEDIANEVVVLEQTAKLPKTGTNPEGKHPHHGMEVICKEGTLKITIPPMQGHEVYGTFVRTTDSDNGRAVFRPEPVGA